MISIWQRRNVWTFGLFPVVGFFLLLSGVFWHEAIAWLLFPWVVFVGIYTSRMRCPSCQQPAGKRQYALFGVRVSWDSPFTPRKCRQCGARLDA